MATRVVEIQEAMGLAGIHGYLASLINPPCCIRINHLVVLTFIPCCVK